MIDVKVTNYVFNPEYSEVYMDSNIFGNSNAYPYKVGNPILCYDAGVNTPKRETNPCSCFFS